MPISIGRGAPALRPQLKGFSPFGAKQKTLSNQSDAITEVKMLKVLAGNLSATFNIDGLHLDRYVARQLTVVQSICDQLLLHDRILIPIQDYVTMAGLVRILGERNLLTLLAEERLAFVRMRGFFGYTQGTGPDGRLIGMVSPNIANSVPALQSIEAALSLIQGEYAETKWLKNSVYACTTELELGTVVDAIHKDAYADLSQSSLWKPEYELANPDLLALPGMAKMQVRVIGPGTDVANDVVDACLALGLMNVELYLAKQFDCVSSASAAPIGDCISLKMPRLTGAQLREGQLWEFLDVTGVPDVAAPLLANRDEMAKFIKLTRGRDAEAFRRWFHENKNLSDKDLLKAYMDVLHDTPWVQGKTGKVLRMAASLGLGAVGFGLIADAATSVIDNFVVDKFVRARGAKFFIDDLRKFTGRLKP